MSIATQGAAVPSDAASRSTRNGIILLTLLLNAMATVSVTVVGVAEPFIGRALGLSDAEALWLTDSYLIALICIALFTGWLMSRLGYRRLLIACIAGTAVLSLTCSAISHVGALTALSFALGLCNGAVAPATLALIVEMFPERERARAMAIWGAGSTVGILVGALASGYLIEHFSWRLPFYLPVPLGLVALPLVLRYVAPRAIEPMKIDAVEAAMLTMAVISFASLLNLGDDFGWFSSPLMTALALVFAVSVAIYLKQLRRAGPSMVDFSILGDRGLAMAALITLGTGFFSTGQFQTALLGGLLHDSPELISLRSALGAVAITGGIMLGGRLASRTRPSTLIAASIAIALVGKLGFVFYGPDITPYMAIWPQIVSGFGLGLMSTPITVAAFDTIAQEQTKQATAIYSLASRSGGALGVAILGVVLDQLQAGSAGGTRTVVESTSPFISIFWIELFGTAAFIPAALMLSRVGEPDVEENVEV